MSPQGREDPQPDRGKGPPDGKGKPTDPGRPMEAHRSSAQVFRINMKLSLMRSRKLILKP